MNWSHCANPSLAPGSRGWRRCVEPVRASPRDRRSSRRNRDPLPDQDRSLHRRETACRFECGAWRLGRSGLRDRAGEQPHLARARRHRQRGSGRGCVGRPGANQRRPVDEASHRHRGVRAPAGATRVVGGAARITSATKKTGRVYHRWTGWLLMVCSVTAPARKHDARNRSSHQPRTRQARRRRRTLEPLSSVRTNSRRNGSAPRARRRLRQSGLPWRRRQADNATAPTLAALHRAAR
jgi:hypothetical protein